MKQRLIIFSTAFVQVLFVTANTVFIAKDNQIAILACGFLISYVWSFNIRKVVFGTNIDRLIYALGASIGGLTGYNIAKLFQNLTIFAE